MQLITDSSKITVTENTSSVIDLTFTSDATIVLTSSVTRCSDHHVISDHVHIRSLWSAKRIVFTRSLHKCDKAALLQDLLYPQWHVGEIFDDLNDRVEF